MGMSPKTTFRRLVNQRALRPTDREPSANYDAYELFPLTVSPSTDSCSASGGASSFLPASSLVCFLHEALRLRGG